MFGVPASLTQVLSERNIHVPTPIQAATLADAISGRDVLGRGRTGSGKTYAFLLPLVTRLTAVPHQARISPPAGADPGSHPRTGPPDRCRPAAVGLGHGPAQPDRLRRRRSGAAGPGAAGRCRRRRRLPRTPGGPDLPEPCRLDQVEITIVDEADHMADLGFLPAVTRLLGQTPRNSQRLFFSATLDKASMYWSSASSATRPSTMPTLRRPRFRT